MKNLICLFMAFCATLCLFMAGCAVTTTIKTDPNGTYTVRSKSDALVVMERSKDDDLKITVDNRGRPGLLEQILGIAVTRTTVDVNVGDDDDDDND